MKRFIQIASFFALAFVFGGVQANAQSSTRIDANVPFDFVVVGKTLPAGEYVIRLNAAASGVRKIEVSTKDGEVVHTALVSANGDPVRGRAELLFDRSGGRTVLAKILTGNAGYTVPAAGEARLTASVRR